MDKLYKIALDIKKNFYKEQIELVSEDVGTNKFEIHLKEDGNNIDLTNLFCKVHFLKPDGTRVVQNATTTNAEKGTIECLLKPNTISMSGRILAEVGIYESESSQKRLTSATFNFIVRKSIVDSGDVLSMNEIPILNRLINDCNNLENEWDGKITQYQNEKKSEFNNWFGNIKNQLNGDIAGNLQTQITNLTADVNVIPKKSWYADLETYYGNTKLISDFQDIGEWTNGSGVLGADNGNVLIGNKSLKISKNLSEHLIYATCKNINLNLSTFNNGLISGNDDYIYIVAYVSDKSKVSSLVVGFRNDVDYANDKTITSGEISNIKTGWNYIAIKKSDFNIHQNAKWSEIKSMRVYAYVDQSAQDVYVSFNLVQLIKKDPLDDYPNPFQKNNIRELTIDGGQWFVGYEFGKLIIKQISDFVANDGTLLTHVNSFKNVCIETINVIANNNKRLDLCAIAPIIDGVVKYDISLFIYLSAAKNVYLRRRYNAPANVYKTFDSIEVGDTIKSKLVYDYTTKVAILTCINLRTSETITLSLINEIYGDMEVVPLFNTSNSAMTKQTTLSMSVTELTHCHHANEAEIAKGLAEQPKCTVYKTNNQSVLTGGAGAILSFDQIAKNIGFNIDLDSELTKIKVVKNGNYNIYAVVRFAHNTAGARQVYLRKNGNEFIGVNSAESVKDNGLSTDMLAFANIDLKVDDYVEVMALQFSGTTLDVNGSSTVGLATRLIIEEVL